MWSVVLSLLSAFCFGLGNVLVRRALPGMDYFTGLFVAQISQALLLWLFLGVASGPIQLWVPVNLIFVGVGLFVPGFTTFLMFTGIERLGASVPAALSSSSPLFAIVLALLFLEERPTPTNLLGALSIIGGLVCLSWRGQTRTWRTRDLLFPLAAAFIYAIRDNLVRFGLLITPTPILGATIAATTSALAVGAAYFAVSGPSRWAGATLSGLLFFLATGFLNFLAYVAMFTALGLDRVSIVSPVVHSFSLFVLPLTFFLLRGVEQITLRKIVATALAVLGVLLISWEKL
jgi:drug/metabolite transporter (DMT)-like permease